MTTTESALRDGLPRVEALHALTDTVMSLAASSAVYEENPGCFTTIGSKPPLTRRIVSSVCPALPSERAAGRR